MFLLQVLWSWLCCVANSKVVKIVPALLRLNENLTSTDRLWAVLLYFELFLKGVWWQSTSPLAHPLWFLLVVFHASHPSKKKDSGGLLFRELLLHFGVLEASGVQVTLCSSSLLRARRNSPSLKSVTTPVPWLCWSGGQTSTHWLKSRMLSGMGCGLSKMP